MSDQALESRIRPRPKVGRWWQWPKLAWALHIARIRSTGPHPLLLARRIRRLRRHPPLCSHIRSAFALTRLVDTSIAVVCCFQRCIELDRPDIDPAAAMNATPPATLCCTMRTNIVLASSRLASRLFGSASLRLPTHDHAKPGCCRRTTGIRTHLAPLNLSTPRHPCVDTSEW